MYEIALMLHEDESIDVLASNGKKHHLLDVLTPENGDLYTICRFILGDEDIVYRIYFQFNSWQSAKKHYDLVAHKGFREFYKKQYF